MNADQFLTSLKLVVSGALAEIQEEELAVRLKCVF